MKPQIGSLVGKESGHALHSSTTNVSIRNAYSSMALHLQDLGIQDTQVDHDPSKFSSKYINDLNRTKTKITTFKWTLQFKWRFSVPKHVPIK